jgi:hypothetical protein
MMKPTFSSSPFGLVKWLQIVTVGFMMVGSLILPLHALAQNATPSDCGDFKAQGPLCLPQSPFANNNGLVNSTSATDLVAKVINLALYFSGIVAVVFIIIGGFYFMTARGNEEQATSGRKTLTYAIIGLVIIIFSFVIVNVITNQLTKGTP